MAVSPTLDSDQLKIDTEAHVQNHRLTGYWIATRSLVLFWLALSLWQIGAFPITGATEAIALLSGLRLATVVDDPAAIVSPVFQERGPLSYLPTAIGAHLFPANEFGMRLPYALMGAAQMPLLIALASRSLGKNASVFAAAILLGTGLFAVNRLASGTSVFTTLELTGALFLLRYVESKERRWLIFASLVFGAATLVFVAGVVPLFVALGVGWWLNRNLRDLSVAALSGLGMVSGSFLLAAVTASVFNSQSELSVTGNHMVGGLLADLRLTGFHWRSLYAGWFVYVGVPALLLTLVGVAEAVVHRSARRREMAVLLILAASITGSAVVWSEQAVLLLPASLLVIALAAFGWARLVQGLESAAARTLVAMVLVSVGLAGIVWNQAVFNPETEFNSSFGSISEYAISIEPNVARPLLEREGIHAITQVLRDEAKPGATILTRDEDSAAVIALYSARDVTQIDLATPDLNKRLNGAYLVIEGDDEAFNAGLSGTVRVIENHRVFSDGEVLFQLLKFGHTGEEFETPVWWRADIAASRFGSENTRYTDFLPLTEKTGESG